MLHIKQAFSNVVDSQFSGNDDEKIERFKKSNIKIYVQKKYVERWLNGQITYVKVSLWHQYKVILKIKNTTTKRYQRKNEYNGRQKKVRSVPRSILLCDSIVQQNHTNTILQVFKREV